MINLECLLDQNSQAQYRCECGKSYIHSGSLYNHKTYHCGKERQFACPHCSYRSSQKGTLKRHLFVKHVDVGLSQQKLLTLKNKYWMLKTIMDKVIICVWLWAGATIITLYIKITTTFIGVYSISTNLLYLQNSMYSNICNMYTITFS